MPKVIDVLGFISNYSYWDEISPRGITKLLREANGEDITVRINSPGGDAFAGIAIYNQLKAYDGNVAVEVIGLAASAASIIALGGDSLTIRKGAMMMIHEPVAFTIGDAARHESTAVSLRKLIDSLADVYVAESSIQLKADDIKTEMEAETWYTAQEAVDKGWASEVTEAKPDDTKKNMRQALTKVQNLWHNPDRIPGHLAGLLQLSEPETTEDTQNVDNAQETRISQLEKKVEQLTSDLATANTNISAKNEAIAKLVEQNKDLKDSNKEAKKSALKAKVEAKLDKARSEGRQFDREVWAKRLTKDFDTFADILDEQPKTVNTGDPDGDSDPGNVGDVDLDDATNKVIVQSMREAGYTTKQIKAALKTQDDLLGEGGDAVDDDDDDGSDEDGGDED